MGTTAEIAAAVLFPASEETSFGTVQTLIVDGGLKATDYAPTPFLDRVGAKPFSWRL